MRKIVFAAIVGYTGEQTKDGRVLVAPESDGAGRQPLLHRPYPLPVVAFVDARMQQVGMIEMAALCDRRIIVFGHLDPREEFDHLVRSLDLGVYGLEMDLDAVEFEQDDDALRLTSWRLAGATVGIDACWDLPHVQIEIMQLKIVEEKSSA